MITANKKHYRKKTKKILEATNNGKCWWLYQMLTYNHRQMKENK